MVKSVRLTYIDYGVVRSNYVVAIITYIVVDENKQLP
jgi:hypothetical protein